MPYMEEQAIYDQANVELQYYGLPSGAVEHQVATYYCPSRRSPPQLSISGDSRGVAHVPGALADYAIASGDGQYMKVGEVSSVPLL